MDQDQLALRVARIQAAATVLGHDYDTGGASSDLVSLADELLQREFKEHLDATDPIHADPASGTAGRAGG